MKWVGFVPLNAVAGMSSRDYQPRQIVLYAKPLKFMMSQYIFPHRS